MLEPVVLLYQHTGDAKYLEFANYIVAQWSNRPVPAQPGTSATLDRIAGPYVLLKSNPKAAQKIGAWMAFDMPFTINGRACILTLCDFASADGEWREGNY